MRNILVLGGGHGLHAVIEALKKEKDYNIKAIISTADSGGHTGRIVEEFNVPAVGDIRRNLASTLDSFPLLQKMFDFRFDKLHDQKDISVGNLMLLSLLQNDNFEKILVQFQKEFHSNVLLLPLYTKPIDLCATYIDGSKGVKEHLIPCENKKIKDVFYNEKLKLTKKVIHSIKEAEYIIIGPGSLYTSVGAVLTDKTVARLVKNSSAKTIYICNIMTEPKETDDYSVLDHVRFIESKIGKSLDYIIANKKELNNIQKEKYASKNASPVKIVKTEKNIMYRNLLDIHQEYVRHDSKKLKKIIKKIIDN